MSGPYAQAAGDYWAASWRGVLPLPPRRKKEPPTGYTGWDGAYPSWPDVQSWIEDRGAGNVCLHLPDGVLGVDVDGYGDKVGAASLAAAEARWGPLPATWWSTSREDHVSGIRFYRVPVAAGGASLAWPGKVGPGIETVHRGHRYAVVAPSIHPDTGRAYRWITPDGVVSTVPPRVADLPELPTAWVVGLTQGREAHTYQGAGMDDAEIRTWLEDHWGGVPCTPMSDVADKLLEEMHDGAHESLRLLMRLVGMAAAGHSGLHEVLGTVRKKFIAEVASRRDDEQTAAEEWTRSLFGAVDNIVGEMAKTGTASSTVDPCQVLESPAVDALVSPAPAATATTASSPLGGDILSEPAPGSVQDASEEPDDDNSLDSSPQPGDEPGDESSDEYQPRELTDDEIAAMAAAQRERDVAKAERDLEIRQEAKQRLAAKNAPPLEWLDSDAFLDGPEPEPLVPRLLYKDSLARIYGKAGCGKSFLSIDLAYSLATGRAWAGTEVERTKVAYVMAEGRRVNTRRGKAWLDRHGVERAELRGWFHAVPHKVLLTEEGVRDLVEQVRGHAIGLVILDTKNAMMVGDENSAEDFALLRRALDRLREATEACVVLIDHTGYGDTARARGSSAGEAGMDTEVHVLNDGQSPPQITVTVTRDKADEAGAAWDFMLRTHPIDDQRPPAVLLPLGDVDLPARKPMPEEVEVAWQSADVIIPLEVLHYTGEGKATVPDLARYMAYDAGKADRNRIGITQAEAKAALSPKTLGKGSGHSPSAVRRAWSWLRDMGYISPADGRDGSDGKAENKTGKHLWSPT